MPILPPFPSLPPLPDPAAILAAILAAGAQPQVDIDVFPGSTLGLGSVTLGS